MHHVLKELHLVCTDDDRRNAQKLLSLLQNESWYSRRLLYRAVCGPLRLAVLRRTGVDHPEYDSIMALTHTQVYERPANPTLFCYAAYGVRSAIAVYDRSQFRQMGEMTPAMTSLTLLEQYDLLAEYVYQFKDPQRKMSSLIALVSVDGMTRVDPESLVDRS